MSRFLGTATKRLGAVDSVYTKAKVFSTPGTTTWDMPPTSQVKVFVIGGGGSYNAADVCVQSNNCYSGNSSLACCYCLNFTGHVMGAGGGYAEKLFTNPSGTATVVVGSTTPGSRNSSFTLGGTTVAATGASDVAYNWSCTNNSSARDNTNDPEITLGFALPTCGYQNNITATWSLPGNGTGGDINSSGGSSVMIPEFRYDSAIFTDGSAGGGGGFVCMVNRHSLFGSTFGSCCWPLVGGGSSSGIVDSKAGSIVFPGTKTQRTGLTSLGNTNAPTPGGGGGATVYNGNWSCNSGYDFNYGWNSYCLWACLCAVGGGSASSATFNRSLTKTSYTPVGMGASSGAFSYSGAKAKAEVFSTTRINEALPAGAVTAAVALGGLTSCSLCCANFGCTCNCGNIPYPFCCIGSYIRDTGCVQTGSAGSTTTPGYFDIVYTQTDSALSQEYAGELPLAGLVSETGANLTNIKFGRGAGGRAATYGGGGNRTYPSGGDGLVVALY